MDSDVEAAAATCARGPTSSPRSRATSITRWRGPTIRCTATNGTSPPSTWSARGTFSPAPRPTSSSRCSIAASRFAPSRFATTRGSRSASTDDGPLYPALGVVDVPFAAAPELGETGSTRFVAPRDFIWDDELPVDLDGHGTHVAGTIGQLTNNGVGVAGMAYNVRIMPVKVIQGVWDDVFDSPNVGTDDVVARGIRYAADNGAKVINMSIGRSEGGAGDGRQRGHPLCDRQGRVRRGGGRQHPRHRQPAQPARRRRRDDRRDDRRGRGRPHARRSRTTRRPASSVEIAAPGGDQRAAATRRASCSRRSTSICWRRTNGRCRSSVRHEPMRLATSISRARRWRRRTCRASRRC